MSVHAQPPPELASARTASLSLSLLGHFELRDGDTRIALPGSAQRLLAFLALGGAVRRAAAAGSLWPEASEVHAFGNLRSALSRLGATGHQAVRADAVDLELQSGVPVDILAARELALRLLAPGPPTPSELSPTSVVVLSAELLPGWYDDWVVVEAEDWRQRRLHGLEALAGHLTRAGRYGEAVLAAGAAVRAEPLRESAHGVLIAVHLAEGNNGEALNQFERLRVLLWAELRLEPSARVRALLSTIEIGSPAST